MNSAMTPPQDNNAGDYLQGLKRRKGRLVLVFAAVLALALAVTFGLPPVYTSRATILIEQQEIPQDLVRSTVTSYADQRVQVISQRVMTTANLSAIIDKYDLYADARASEPLEVVVTGMREDDVALELVSADVVDPRSGRAVQATIAFQLAYSNENPVLAQKVTNELVSLFLNENLKSRTEVAEESLSFLSEEAAKLERRVAGLERDLAGFKARNAGRLPELNTVNLGLLDRTENQLLEAQRTLSTLEERRFMLAGQLAQLEPTLERLDLQGGRLALSPSERLKALQTEYLNLLSRYSAEHPDVQRTRREMEGLSAELGARDTRGLLGTQRAAVAAELAGAEQRYAPGHPDVRRLRRELEQLDEQIRTAGVTPVPMPEDLGSEVNPAYVQLEAQLEGTVFEIASTREKIRELERKIADYEARLLASPEVEREYRSLMRDYELAVAKYREVTAKEMEAQLARSLETEQKGERFTLIEPPLLPEEPASPNRPAIAFLGAVFAVAGGLGTAALAEAVDHGVYGARGVTRLMGAPPLSVIPRIELASDRRRRVWRRLAWTLGALLTLLAVVLAFHYTVRPVDVLYFRLLHAVGL